MCAVVVLFGLYMSKPSQVTTQEFSLELPRSLGRGYTSEIMKADQLSSFESIAFDGDMLDGALLTLRTQQGSEWTAWEPIDSGHDYFVFTGTATAFQFQLSPTGEVHDEIRFGISPKLFISAIHVPERIALPFFDTAHASQPRIVSRDEWGADPDLVTEDGYNKAREEYCKKALLRCIIGTSSDEDKDVSDYVKKLQELYPDEMKIKDTIYEANGKKLLWPVNLSDKIKKIVVHHTAELNGKDMDGDGHYTELDEMAALRSIYYFHTVIRGWGDIGYNYIVGPTGNIYQGRLGGDYAVGAHALWRNVSSLGVSIMGNFQEQKIGARQLESVTYIVARLAKIHGINPLGTSSFYGKDLPNIIGHADVGKTACPGDNVKSLLDKIRQDASDLTQYSLAEVDKIALTTEKYAASVDRLEDTIQLEPIKDTPVTVRIKNMGTINWDNKTYLSVGKDSYNGFSFLNQEKNRRVAYLKESQVKPGEVGTFSYTVRTDYRQFQDTVRFTPVLNGMIELESFDTRFTIFPMTFTYDVVSSDLPKGALKALDQVNGKVVLKNTGTVPWLKTGAYRTILRVDNPRTRNTAFNISDSKVLATLSEERVEPGKTGTFVISLRAPQIPGQYKEDFAPAIEGMRYFDGKGFSFDLTVNTRDSYSPFTLQQSRPIEQIVLDVNKEKKVNLTVKYKQAASTSSSPATPTTITISSNAVGADILKTKEFSLTAEMMKEGASINIPLTLKAAQGLDAVQIPIYLETSYGPVSGSTPINISVKTTSKSTGNQSGSAITGSIVSITPTHISSQSGIKTRVTLRVKNTSKTAWVKDGTLLGLYDGRDKSNPLVTSTWIDDYTPARMKEEKVSAGGIATFVFDIFPKDAGAYLQTYRVGIKGSGWVDMPSAELSVEVKGMSKKSSGKFFTIGDAKIKKSLRVKISYAGTDSIDIAANKGSALQIEKIDGAKKTVHITRQGDQLMVEGSSNTFSGGVRISTTSDDVLAIKSMDRYSAWDTEKKYNNNLFRGMLEVRIVDSKLTVINELPLEDYLYGIAEAALDDPIEKKKTLSVLARTYALYYMQEAKRKFPDKPYDASDDPDIFQKYMGYSFEVRSGNWVEVVNATRGQVVAYRDKLIKTPYFSESDGKTKNAKDVWGWTDTPYLVSVSDTFCKDGKGTLKGHGVGLSGCGAATQASQGKTYKDIISYYYTGVTISSLKE